MCDKGAHAWPGLHVFLCQIKMVAFWRPHTIAVLQRCMTNTLSAHASQPAAATTATTVLLHLLPTHLKMEALVEDTWSHSMPLLLSLTTATRQNLFVCTDLSTMAVPVVMGTLLLRAVLRGQVGRQGGLDSGAAVSVCHCADGCLQLAIQKLVRRAQACRTLDP